MHSPLKTNGCTIFDLKCFLISQITVDDLPASDYFDNFIFFVEYVVVHNIILSLLSFLELKKVLTSDFL